MAPQRRVNRTKGLAKRAAKAIVARFIGQAWRFRAPDGSRRGLKRVGFLEDG
jgi:hypothetical protein